MEDSAERLSGVDGSAGVFVLGGVGGVVAADNGTGDGAKPSETPPPLARKAIRPALTVSAISVIFASKVDGSATRAMRACDGEKSRART